jgi:hypothetical protein
LEEYDVGIIRELIEVLADLCFCGFTCAQGQVPVNGHCSA